MVTRSVYVWKRISRQTYIGLWGSSVLLVVSRIFVGNHHRASRNSERAMSAKETMNRRAPVEALDFDEMKLWR
ncbi:MAG: hypothetical protein AABY30_00655, partial [Candidatus Thermoplasmatota archaeon]